MLRENAKERMRLELCRTKQRGWEKEKYQVPFLIRNHQSTTEFGKSL